VSVELRVPSVELLHERRSEKWAPFGRAVLSATIAEMVYPLAEPVTQALRAAIARHDLGYAPPAPRSLRRAFGGFTGRVLSRSEIVSIAERCAEREVWVLADEIHAPLTLPGARHTSWLELSDAARDRGVALATSG
jgi:bifunctional pyridoxal-dependent enzyme with beta-cystathionase and maltose regulon repressor activities